MKTGDFVICTNNVNREDSITKGKVYLVTLAGKYGGSIRVINDNNEISWHSSVRFKVHKHGEYAKPETVYVKFSNAGIPVDVRTYGNHEHDVYDETIWTEYRLAE